MKLLSPTLLLCALLSSALAVDSVRDRLLHDESLSQFISFEDQADAEISQENPVANLNGGAVYEDGVVGRAISFVGPDGGSVRYHVAKNFNPEAGTLMFWFKPEWEGGGTGEKYTLAWITMGDPDRYFAIHRSFNDDPQALFVNFHWDNACQISSREIFHGGEWKHLAVTWDERKNRYAFYLNGLPIKEAPWKPLDPQQYTAKTLSLGKYYPEDSPINALYDEFFLFKRALSSEEVNAYYQQTQK